MSPEDFAGLVGGRLAHVTPAANLAGIEAEGLLPAAEIARRAGVEARPLRKKVERLRWGEREAVLNHQMPLRAGRDKDFLDGIKVEAWARLLDERVFLWPEARGAAFAASLPGAATLWLDARRALEALGSDLWLSPINSGSATRRPARRGAWLYVSATASVEEFRENRRRRGLIAGRDTVAEVSVTRAIAPAELAALRVEGPAG